MEAGFTFLLTKEDKHLWVILSDPSKDSQSVVLVSFTTPAPHKDQACLVPRGAHPWLTHDSLVAYEYAKKVSVANLVEWKNVGLLKLQEPVPAELLERMRQAAADSTTLITEYADILIEQGLLDC